MEGEKRDGGGRGTPRIGKDWMGRDMTTRGSMEQKHKRADARRHAKKHIHTQTRKVKKERTHAHNRTHTVLKIFCTNTDSHDSSLGVFRGKSHEESRRDKLRHSETHRDCLTAVLLTPVRSKRHFVNQRRPCTFCLTVDHWKRKKRTIPITGCHHNALGCNGVPVPATPDYQNAQCFQHQCQRTKKPLSPQQQVGHAPLT